jgi:hypothetical protein
MRDESISKNRKYRMVYIANLVSLALMPNKWCNVVLAISQCALWPQVSILCLNVLLGVRFMLTSLVPKIPRHMTGYMFGELIHAIAGKQPA